MSAIQQRQQPTKEAYGSKSVGGEILPAGADTLRAISLVTPLAVSMTTH